MEDMAYKKEWLEEVTIKEEISEDVAMRNMQETDPDILVNDGIVYNTSNKAVVDPISSANSRQIFSEFAAQEFEAREIERELSSMYAVPTSAWEEAFCPQVERKPSSIYEPYITISKPRKRGMKKKKPVKTFTHIGMDEDPSLRLVMQQNQQILQQLMTINLDVQMVKRGVNFLLEGKAPLEDVSQGGIIEKLPITNEQEFEVFNQHLRDSEEERKTLIRFIIGVGGVGHEEAIKRCMTRFFNIDFSVRISFTGKKSGKSSQEKVRLQGCPLIQCLMAALMQQYGASEREVEKGVMSSLKNLLDKKNRLSK